MKLNKISKITGEISCLSNLHIGGGKDTLGIGAMDNPVIKHPITMEPYIPGSSLKGKMRCSMERMERDLSEATNEKPCACDQCMVCRIFGSLNNTKKRVAPTRLIVRDAPLTEKSREQVYTSIAEGRGIFDVKSETAINRSTGQAQNGSLRQVEYVPSGLSFKLELVLQVFDGDREDECIAYVKKALKAVEDTYIGGMGSRGYGQIKLVNMQLDGQPFEL